tara:strand:+ start:988 stop:1662 length:675 start_codon:yes stop_codon:yes gene_type:complete
VHNVNDFENIDYFAKAFNIQTEGVSTRELHRQQQDTSIFDEREPNAGDGDTGVIEGFPGMPGMPGLEDPASEDNSVRDWLLRRHMTLHTKEVNEKLKNKEEIVVHDPFAKPEEDASDPFYPGGLEGNPNTEEPEITEIVYNPEAEDVEAEESQNPDLGDPSGERSSIYRCYIPNTEHETQNLETGMNHTQEECANINGEWKQVSMNTTPNEDGLDEEIDMGAGV